jgi:4-hydroxy-2-oxoheptanedioate aldolase
MNNMKNMNNINPMNRRDFLAATAGLVASASVASAQQTAPAPAATPPAPGRGPQVPGAAPGTVTFNTVIPKLKAGQQVFSNTLYEPDLEAAKKACVGQDFIWIEMQHSTLTWRESQLLIETIAAEGCMPFLRVPSATEGDVQKATDAGALGIIFPMVYSLEQAHNAIKYAKFPVGNINAPNVKPWGHRSNGQGHATKIWGKDYMTNANNNVLIMIQIENPEGVGLVNTILEEVEGIDIVMVASNDFGQQAGDRDGSPTYNAREEIVRKAVLAHGKYLAGPSSWRNRPGYSLFQGTRTAATTGYNQA